MTEPIFGIGYTVKKQRAELVDGRPVQILEKIDLHHVSVGQEVYEVDQIRRALEKAREVGYPPLLEYFQGLSDPEKQAWREAMDQGGQYVWAEESTQRVFDGPPPVKFVKSRLAQQGFHIPFRIDISKQDG